MASPKKTVSRALDFLEKLSGVYSPTGYSHEALQLIASWLKKEGIAGTLTNKGALLAGNHPTPQLVVAAHADTLGAMVNKLNGNGTLGITPIGGLLLPTFEGGYVTVKTGNDKGYRGTLLLNNPAAHVNPEAGKTERKADGMHIRLDEEVKSRADLEKLGIQIGDFICFDARFEVTPSGFIKSHFLDDKAGCAAILDAMVTLGAAKLKRLPVAFFFSNYEEVGHGASAGLPETATEMLVVDMGVVGQNVEGDERCVSICAKDSTGPYDLGIRQRLTKLAKAAQIPYKLDVFPFYGSDGSAALHAGYNLRVGLIGPGVSASHGNERTHRKGLEATRDLILAYIRDTLGK